VPKPEIYISIDIETDGPAPGLFSMLSLGAIALDPDGDEKDAPRWYSTLKPLPTAAQHPDTMKWWETQPAAWEEVNRDQRPAWDAIPEFADWVTSLPGKAIAAAWPAQFDGGFVNYYCHRFARRNPLGIACLDIRSYANGLAGVGQYGNISKNQLLAMTGEIDTQDLRDHVALDDAISQGRLLIKLIQYARTQGNPILRHLENDRLSDLGACPEHPGPPGNHHSRGTQAGDH